jgi:hypothetical protein
MLVRVNQSGRDETIARVNDHRHALHSQAAESLLKTPSIGRAIAAPTNYCASGASEWDSLMALEKIARIILRMAHSTAPTRHINCPLIH